MVVLGAGVNADSLHDVDVGRSGESPALALPLRVIPDVLPEAVGMAARRSCADMRHPICCDIR
jgi:hypothetical protein